MAVVTGATGFIGAHLSSHLSERGWRVRAIVRPESRRPLPSGIETVTAPLLMPDLARAVEGAHAVFHLAALVDARTPAEFKTVNVEATRHVAEAAKAVGARLVHVSSLAAAGPSGDPHRDETAAPAPINEYGRSKLEGERVVQAMDGLDWTIARPTLVYGPGDRNFLPLFRLAARGLFFRIAAPTRPYNLVHVRDVARALELAALSPDSRRVTWAAGHPKNIPLDDVFRTLAGVYGRAYRPITVPVMLLRVVAMISEILKVTGAPRLLDRARMAELEAPGFACNVDRARRLLGVEAQIGLRDGFLETARWYHEAGWIARRPSRSQQRL